MAVSQTAAVRVEFIAEVETWASRLTTRSARLPERTKWGSEPERPDHLSLA